MFSNRNKKVHTTSYTDNKKEYCCQSPNTCVKFNRTQADIELLKQFNESNGNKELDMDCKVCKNINLLI